MSSRRRSALLCGCLLATPAAAALAAEAPPATVTPAEQRPPPGAERALRVVRVAGGPHIDGRLDDPAWQDLPVAGRFWISEQQRWPAAQTEVRVVSDGQTLFFAFHCHDPQPQGIVARETRRDAGLGYDDRVSVELDPFLDRRAISSFSVNAIGTQSDVIAGGRARKIEWKGDWQAAVARDAGGWTAEIAIPLAILNFRPGDAVFGANFIRYQHRTDELSRWADIGVRALPDQMGRLTDLELPEAGKRTPWTLMPFVVTGRNLPDKDGVVKDFLANAGADLRYEPRRNLTAVLSLNPDFTQVERQVTDIDFSYNEKATSEPRPFFQEGAAYFGSDRRYFYSPRLPDFDVGAKLFAQPRGLRAGALLTSAPDGRWDAVLRGQRLFDATHSLAGMLVGGRRPDLQHALAVLELEGREPSGLNYGVDLALTSNRQARTDTGSLLEGTLGWQADHWSLSTTVDRVDRAFFPADGLIAADLIGTRGASAALSYYRDFGPAALRELSGSITHSERYTEDGRLQRRDWYFGGSVESARQVKFGLYYYTGDYRPALGGERGAYAETLFDDHYWTASLDFNTRSNTLGYGLGHSWGFLGGDDYEYPFLYVWLKPTRSTVLNLNTERLKSFGSFRQSILSGTWELTPEQSLSGRYVRADGATSVRLAYARRVRAGTDVFLVYDREAGADPRLSLKLAWSLP